MIFKIMKTQKFGNCMSVISPLFETKMNTGYGYFCGQPYLYLTVWEKDGNITATFGIGDNDDFDIYNVYENTTKEFVHELINKMKDYKYYEILEYNEIADILEIKDWK